jgi:hypothetical protein
MNFRKIKFFLYLLKSSESFSCTNVYCLVRGNWDSDCFLNVNDRSRIKKNNFNEYKNFSISPHGSRLCNSTPLNGVVDGSNSIELSLSKDSMFNAKIFDFSYSASNMSKNVSSFFYERH